jgi:ribonuclease HI
VKKAATVVTDSTLVINICSRFRGNNMPFRSEIKKAAEQPAKVGK